MFEYVIVYKPFTGQFENMIVPAYGPGTSVVSSSQYPYGNLIKACMTTVLFVLKYTLF